MTSDEIVYNRFVKHLTKKAEINKQQKELINKKRNAKSKQKNKDIDKDIEILEDTNFSRVVQQAKSIKNPNLKEIEMSSIKKLRQFYSYFTTFVYYPSS